MRGARFAAVMTIWILGAGLTAPVHASIPPDETSRSALSTCDESARFRPVRCAGRKARPETIDEFLAVPTTAEWQAQLAMGWIGSDGSTAASDFIAGVQVGETSRDRADVDLPANRHDWYYEVGRSHGLGWRFRRAADQAYRDMCLERLADLEGVSGAAARLNVHGRYVALRIVGIGAWIARPGA